VRPNQSVESLVAHQLPRPWELRYERYGAGEADGHYETNETRLE
jgi:hypothetical protein